MKKILFISWDGPQTSYMEGLFMPIFNKISKHEAYTFHILQFTWAKQEKIDAVQSKANEYGIRYTFVNVSHKPIASIGSILTLLKGPKVIKKYIDTNAIDIVMPRSNFPGFMVNRIKNLKAKIVFDADGLALEERVDFAGLRKNSFMYGFLSRVELKMLKKADAILVRSNKSIDIHLNKKGVVHRGRFFKVFNGRDVLFFKKKLADRNRIRAHFSLAEDDKLFVYCGSLGPQYGWDEMMEIFLNYLDENTTAKFLILSGNPEFAKSKTLETLKEKIIIKSVPFAQVPAYLSAADIAFAIRQPTFSMQGVAPIKLGEYLLMELPTIASKGIGDSEDILEELENTFIFDHKETNNINNIITFVNNIKNINTSQLRKVGVTNFSLEESAKSYLKALYFLEKH